MTLHQHMLPSSFYIDEINEAYENIFHTIKDNSTEHDTRNDVSLPYVCIICDEFITLPEIPYISISILEKKFLFFKQTNALK